MFTMFSRLLIGQTKIPGGLLRLSQRALEENPSLKRSLFSVKSAAADLRMQKGAFDYTLLSELSFQNTGYHLFNTDPRNEFLNEVLKTNNWDFNIGLQKMFKSGQIAELGVQYSYNNSNIPFNNFSQAVPRYRGDYTGLLNFSLTQPILQGSGKDITTIPKRISKLYIKVAKENSVFFTSSKILEVGMAYWNYYTAFRRLKIYKQNEDRASNVLNMTAELVEADKRPKADLVQIEADLANQERLTKIAEQNLYNARLNLGRSIGLNETESSLIGKPLNEYPKVNTSGYREGLNKSYFIKLALENRSDLAAAQKVKSVQELRLKLAKNNKKPQLDLTGFAFYGNASQGNGKAFALSTFTNNEGRYVGVGARLTFTLPLGNNIAKGNYIKSKIALKDQTVAKKNLQRHIKLSVSIALNDLTYSVIILKKAIETVENYREAFRNEQAKFRAGLTTLLNLIIFQERLTNAELNLIHAKRQFASAIINLRNNTGTLIEKEDKGFLIDKTDFYTIPINNQ